MFMSKEKQVDRKDAETVIGAGVEVEGNFAAYGDIIVRGKIRGSIETKNDFYADEEALVEAEIKSNNAFVSGEVRGNLHIAEKIQMASTARVHGDVYCRLISMEEGAIFNGKCVMEEGAMKKSEE